MSETEGVNSACDHLTSEEHKNPENIDKNKQLSKKAVKILEEKNCKDIVFCERLLKNSAFCIICQNTVNAYPSHIEQHIDTIFHRKNAKGQKSGKKLLEKILKENEHILKPTTIEGVKLCIVCKRDVKVSEYHVVNNHLSSKKHTGIFNEDDSEIGQISIKIDEEDP